MTPILPVILAGGGGTRLWPLSRRHYPKQLLSVSGEGTLLQGALERMPDGPLGGVQVQPPLVVCNEAHRFLVGEQGRRSGREGTTIVLEPVGRNTAPALTCAALLARRDGGDPLLLMMPADHLIADIGRFRAAVLAGVAEARAGRLVTFGIVPTAPETGYGYIQLGAPRAGSGGEPKAYALEAFKEKPDAQTAQRYIEDGAHRWNAGIFLVQASRWLDAMAEFRADILSACERSVAAGTADGDFFRLQESAFAACPSDSIDYAVVERITTGNADRASVVSLDANWSDVGSWSSLWEISAKDPHGNAVRGDVYAVDCKDNVLFAESRLVAALGCHDMVIVETADAVMVAPKARAQEVKAIVDWLDAQERGEHLRHRRVHRPWGSYEGIDTGERFEVKRIVVDPGAALPPYMHRHCAAHWIVVKGAARVTRGEEVFVLGENESTYISVGERHRLENPGTTPIEIIEVRTGVDLGEDDIVRFQEV